MRRPRHPGSYGLALSAVMAAVGLAWRDCLLLACSVALAYRLFLLWMDRGAPWPPLTAALNALTGGVLAGAAGLALITGIGTAGLGWWHPQAPHEAPAMLAAALAAGWCCAARDSPAGARHELRVWLWVLGGALLAVQAYGRGLAIAPCLFALAVGAVLSWAGWRLARYTTSALLQSSNEMP